MGRTLNEMLSSRSVDSQQRIQEMANELLLEVRLQALREELEVSQVELASVLGISQPAVVAMEQRGNDIKLSTMKRYVEAMGGKLRVDVELPTGRHGWPLCYMGSGEHKRRYVHIDLGDYAAFVGAVAGGGGGCIQNAKN
ncbi:helix-turn-helix domain-containing protein [Aeromonas sp. 82P]|uniref:helix-turn-helix domain-containing protein n=1 Tax=Aeromonas sp. 82P TaxID=3452726 RepID=UPI003F7ADC4F